MRRSRWQRTARGFARGLVYLSAAALLIAGIALGAVETEWGKNQLRALIVSQANQYLTATLEIGELSGSLLRGIQLRDVRLTRASELIISIDSVSLSYTIRELVGRGVSLRTLRIARPIVSASRGPDGAWNLGALIRREGTQRGPARPLEIRSIEITDAVISLSDPLTFGAFHLPTRFRELNASMSFVYEPPGWNLQLELASWQGERPTLSVKRLSGGIGNGPPGWTLRSLLIDTASGRLLVDGAINRRSQPTTLDLRVKATPFSFQEWAEVVTGLRNIGIIAEFDTRLAGPLAALDTDMTLTSNGGSIRGAFQLNTTVRGWRGAGAVDVDHIDLARWLAVRIARPTSRAASGSTLRCSMDAFHVARIASTAPICDSWTMRQTPSKRVERRQLAKCGSRMPPPAPMGHPSL